MEYIRHPGIFPGCILALLLASCTNGPQQPQSAHVPDARVNIPFRKDGTLTFHRSNGADIVTIDIEIADTDSARTRGLMQRDALSPNAGMLFIFDRAQPRAFWMANTRIGLDIIYVGADSTIVDIKRYVRPMSPESVPSERSAQFVVEVSAGFADSHGLVASDYITWSEILPLKGD